MKILIIMGGFFPGKKFGGPPVSVDNFCSLMQNDECYIVTRDHDLFETERYHTICDGWNERANCKVLYLSDADYGRDRFEQVICDLKPDILYLQGLFQRCVFPCLRLSKKYGLRVFLAPRGEVCDGALRLKKYKKIPYIYVMRLFGLFKNIQFQSTSDEETRAIKHWLKADSSAVHQLDNIPSIPPKIYQRREKISGTGRFIFLSRIHPKKNLLGAIRFFHHVRGNATLSIYGPIEDKAYWAMCQDEIRKLPPKITVEYCGLVSHDKVHEVFSQYDAFVFPTISENYGHVIAEALVVGTPVIISDQTPWTDVNEASVGGAFALSDTEGFCNCINSIINMSENDMKKTSSMVKQYVEKKLNIGDLQQKYQRALNIR